MVHRRERGPEVDHYPVAVDLGQRDRSDEAVDEHRLAVQPDGLDTADVAALLHRRLCRRDNRGEDGRDRRLAMFARSW